MSHSVVIGGAGFVGSWVVEELLKDSQSKVTIIDNLLSSERWNISTDPRVSFIEGSASNMHTLDKIIKPVDFIYQLACYHGNQNSIARPLEDLEHCLSTTLTALQWTVANSPQTTFVYTGAGCSIAEKTWDIPKPVKEIDQISLLHDSPYSISKTAGEMYCLFFQKEFALKLVRVRFQNVYGPREILGAGFWRGTEHTIWRNVIPSFVWKSLHNHDLIVNDSKATRDFIFVSDVARATVAAAKAPITPNAFNIASGKETNIFHLAQLIVRMTNSQSVIHLTQRRQWDNSGRRYADISNSFKSLNFFEEYNLNQGLYETIEWQKNNIDRIQSTIDKHINLIPYPST